MKILSGWAIKNRPVGIISGWGVSTPLLYPYSPPYSLFLTARNCQPLVFFKNKVSFINKTDVPRQVFKYYDKLLSSLQGETQRRCSLFDLSPRIFSFFAYFIHNCRRQLGGTCLFLWNHPCCCVEWANILYNFQTIFCSIQNTHKPTHYALFHDLGDGIFSSNGEY